MHDCRNVVHVGNFVIFSYCAVYFKKKETERTEKKKKTTGRDEKRGEMNGEEMR